MFEYGSSSFTVLLFASEQHLNAVKKTTRGTYLSSNSDNCNVEIHAESPPGYTKQLDNVSLIYFKQNPSDFSFTFGKLEVDANCNTKTIYFEPVSRKGYLRSPRCIV